MNLLKTCILWLGAFALTLTAVFAAAALAQAPAGGAPTDPNADLVALFGQALDAMKTGKWLLAVPLLVLLLVGGVRKWGPAVIAFLPDDSGLDRVLTWLLTSTWGGWTLNLLVTAGATLGGAIATGVPLTWAGGLALLFTIVAAGVKNFQGDVKDTLVLRRAGEKGGGSSIGSVINRP